MTTRTLIVDDSAFMQQFLSAVLDDDEDIEVVGVASDPLQARGMIKELDPDVITLDVEMPKMDGLNFLQKIMALRPMPVVMISSHTARGAKLSLDALSTGAFCCLPKPQIDDQEAIREIQASVRQAARSRDYIVNRARKRTQQESTPARSPSPTIASTANQPELILIGSSTGGVEALTSVFSKFPADCPPTVVTQHMPAAFTQSFAERLNRLCAPNVKEASDREALQPGNIYIAPGSIAHTIVTKKDVLRTRIVNGDPVSGHMPSVDVLFESGAACKAANISAAILTGMGSDGAKGMRKLRESGATTIAQDEDTSLVYGMPKAAVNLNAAQRSLPLEEIGPALFEYAPGIKGIR